MRPTWHMVLPADIRWLLALTAPRVHAASAHAYRRLGLAEADFRRAEELFVHAMQGGKDLSRAEIVRLLEGAGVDTAGQRLGYLLMHAELEGIISSGAPRGKQRTYALLAERAPAARELSPDEALAELTLRYLRSHGPATLRDYRWWSGLTAADARRGLEMVLSALDHLEVGGHTYWFEGAPPAEPLPAPVAHLLQGYDELFMGYSETRGVLDVARLSQGTWTNPGAFVHGVLVDGQIVGRWRRVLAAREVIVELLLLRPLALDERRALDVAVAHYGTFAGLPACTRDVSPAEG